jgi:hypothetical protein
MGAQESRLFQDLYFEISKTTVVFSGSGEREGAVSFVHDNVHSFEYNTQFVQLSKKLWY